MVLNGYEAVIMLYNISIKGEFLRCHNLLITRRSSVGPRYQIYQGVTVHTVTPLFVYRTGSGQLRDILKILTVPNPDTRYQKKGSKQ